LGGADELRRGPADDRNAVDVLEELLGERDLFRLVIRGFALISDEAVENAFGGSIPSELSRLRLPARLALAEALAAVTPELSEAIQRLGKIRHRLAHTVEGDVTDEEVRRVWDAITAAGELDGQDRTEYSPGDQLRVAISALWSAVDDAGAAAYGQRSEVQKALTAYREHRDARSREFIRAWGKMRAAKGSGAALHPGDA
jgi:hypothetical protein